MYENGSANIATDGSRERPRKVKPQVRGVVQQVPTVINKAPE
jgi:hypothetical protein